MKTKFFLSPFIHIFELDKDHYLLMNTYNLSIIRLKKDTWESLNKYIGSELTPPKDVLKVLDELKKREFIYNFPIDRKLMMNILEYTLQRYIWDNPHFVLWLSVTSRCNLGCPYCYLSKKPGFDMTRENADIIIEFTKKQLNKLKADTLAVVYYGGEPLLNFDIIRYLHENFCAVREEYKINYYASIITNGASLSLEIIQELNKLSVLHNVVIDIQVTIDGDEHTHNRYRPFSNGSESFHKIYTNFLLLVRNYKGGSIHLRSNMDEHNLEGIKRLLSKIRRDLDESVSKISVGFRWIFPSQEAVIKHQVPFALFKNQAESILDLYEYAKELGFKIPLSIIVGGPCLILNRNAYVIDEDLKVYKCPGLLYTDKWYGILNESGEVKIFQPYNLIQFLGDLRKCYLSCEYGSLCYGGCRVMKGCYKEYLNVFISSRCIRLFGD